MQPKQPLNPHNITISPITGQQLTINYNSIEATLIGTNSLTNPQILAVFKAEFGFDPLRPSKEFDWSAVKVIERVVPAILGWKGTHEENLFRLGKATLEGWGETVLGKILTAATGRATPARALELMVKNLSLKPEFGKHQYEKLGETRFLFSAKGDPRQPYFVAGLLVPILEKTGVTNYSWIVREKEPLAFEIEISWTE